MNRSLRGMRAQILTMNRDLGAQPTTRTIFTQQTLLTTGFGSLEDGHIEPPGYEIQNADGSFIEANMPGYDD